MTSILTNAAALAALQTLRDIDRNMETTQARVSSGLRVETAADNAAYWSISTTMKSDNKALSAVQDALGLGAAKVDTAYAAMNSAIELVKEIKAKIVAAYGVGADRGKIQEEITQLQGQLKSISESASFSGENWLQGSIADNGTPPAEKVLKKEVVGSFVRDSAGNVSVKTITYNMDSSTVLFDLSGNNFGILDSHASFVAENETVVSVTNTATSPSKITKYAVPTKTDAQILVAATATADVNADDRVYSNGTDMYFRVAKDQWVKVISAAPANSTNDVKLYTDNNGTTTDWYLDTAVSGATTLKARDLKISITSFSINDVPDIIARMNSMVPGSYIDTDVFDFLERFVDVKLSALTSAASSLGSIQSRIELQEGFVSTLMDVIDKGVGRLVDADMNEESTRLKALQTQQQLGIQSLSIANTNAENILTLFQ